MGKYFPQECDTESTKIQASFLAILRPPTVAWYDLLDLGIVVPATEVLSLIQHTICLVTSQLMREKILGAIDQS